MLLHKLQNTLSDETQVNVFNQQAAFEILNNVMKYYIMLEGNSRWRVQLDFFNVLGYNFSIGITTHAITHAILLNKTTSREAFSSDWGGGLQTLSSLVSLIIIMLMVATIVILIHHKYCSYTVHTMQNSTQNGRTLIPKLQGGPKNRTIFESTQLPYMMT